MAPGIHRSLRHAASLKFRFDFGDGETIVVSNDFGVSKIKRGRTALRLEATEDLGAAFDLDGLASSSGALFDKLRSAHQVSVTAELPLGLSSNAIVLPLEPW